MPPSKDELLTIDAFIKSSVYYYRIQIQYDLFSYPLLQHKIKNN